MDVHDRILLAAVVAADRRAPDVLRRDVPAATVLPGALQHDRIADLFQDVLRAGLGEQGATPNLRTGLLEAQLRFLLLDGGRSGASRFC